MVMQEHLLSNETELALQTLPSQGVERLSYPYAKRHGVIVTQITPRAVEVIFRKGGSNTPLLELRRQLT